MLYKYDNSEYIYIHNIPKIGDFHFKIENSYNIKNTGHLILLILLTLFIICNL